MKTPIRLAAAAVLAAAACLEAGPQPPPSEPSPKLRAFGAAMRRGLRDRGVEDEFAAMKAFFAQRLDASAGTNTFSDKTGNCRLAWVDHLLRNPEAAADEAEVFTRTLHEAALRGGGDLGGAVDCAAPKLTRLGAPDPGRAARPPGRTPTAPKDGHAAMAAVADALAGARTALDQALAPLTPAERAELRAEIHRQTTDIEGLAHRVADPVKGRRVFDLLERLDADALREAARSAALLGDPRLLRTLARFDAGPAPAGPVPGATGMLAARLDSPAGAIVVGGPLANAYDLELMTGVCAVVDLGGDDVYREGSVGAECPVLALIDLAGNDRYEGTNVGIQGAAVLGVSVLADLAGDDEYRAGDVAQGACLGGAGLLFDAAGSDRYTAVRRAQGQAIAGIGILLDGGGDDAYRVAVLGQGVGGPLGLGLLDDLAGRDTYYAGGLYPDPYDDSPGYSGFSQGAGVGPRGTANGGIGVLLDGGGDDLYEADGFAHAGAYWFSAGLARDFGGNDRRIGATRLAFDGSERMEKRFVRYGVCFGCHYGVAVLLDDAGDDTYFADFASLGFSWDVAVAALWDGGGHDTYHAPGHGAAHASNAGLSLLFDAGGDDTYTGAPPAVVKAQSEYHTDPAAHNFSFLIDLGGQDRYPGPLTNRLDYVRGWAGGFLIDR